MASEASTCIPRLSSGNDSVLTVGLAADKSRPDIPRWNTVRQGNSWLNGVFHESDVCVISDTNATNDLSGCIWENVHLEIDRIANEAALQDVVPKERAACQSCSTAWQRECECDSDRSLTGGPVSAKKASPDEPRWNSLRQGNIWINGLLHEQDFYMINDSKATCDVAGFWESIDWIANEITFQEVMQKEVATCQSPDSGDGSTQKQGSGGVCHEFGDCDLYPVTTAIRSWEIWGPSVPLIDCNKSVNPIRAPVLGDMPSQSTWTAVDTGLHNVYSDSANKKAPQSVASIFLRPAWSSKDSLTQNPRVSIECGTKVVDLIDEKKVFQELLEDGRLQETIKQEMLKERLWPVHSFGQRGCTHRDDNVPGNQNDLNIMEKVTEAGQSRLMATWNCNEAGSSTHLCLTLDHCDSGTKYAKAKCPSLKNNCSADDVNSSFIPHHAFLYAFFYLNWHDLLAVERVCKLFRDSVRDDVLLWQRLHVEPPFNEKLTDERLLQLAARAKGQLRCLSLLDCFRVSENAVEQVVRLNPKLSKLCLPGCSRITADAVLRIVKDHMDHKVAGTPVLKQLRIRNIYGLTREHLEILQSMLQTTPNQTSMSKPQFYLNGHSSSPCNDQRPIDVEACPKCGNARIVYDCTREKCQQVLENKLQECRGCIFCIARCEECGMCINDNDYEETFCLDLLCSACWLRLPKCAECNKPGCGRHVDHFIRSSDRTLVCGDCCGCVGANGTEFHVP